jgi:valyl-tRNA synthetase
MDTWATSAVSPQLSSFAINDEFFVDLEKHKNLFPFDLRPQAHEILRTWAFYTILKSHLHENTIPWKNIMISGWCLAEDKTKMSKSKGNIISPLSLIENYGADVIRYWASTSKLGADTAFSEEFLKIGKKLVNKIWNASKFASSHFSKIDIKNSEIEDLVKEKIISHTSDLWIISKLQKTLVNATSSLEKFEYADSIEYIENFFWRDFCDNYLEISKVRCYNEAQEDNKGQISAIHTLYYTLKIILELFAPFIPHITDEIYTILYNSKSIHQKGTWPKMKDYLFDENSTSMGQNLIIILDLVRKAKSAKNLSMKSEIKTLQLPTIFSLNDDIINDLRNVTNTSNIVVSDEIPDLEEISDDKGNKIYIEI